MATTINLGKVVPEKGVDYFTSEEIAEFKAQATAELQDQITTNATNIATADGNISRLDDVTGTTTDTYDTSTQYYKGDIVVKGNKYYVAKENVTGAWNASKWEEISVRQEQDLQTANIAKNASINKLLIDDYNEKLSFNSDNLYIRDAASAPIDKVTVGKQTNLTQNNYSGKNKMGIPDTEEYATSAGITYSAQDEIITLTGETAQTSALGLLNTAMFNVSTGNYTINIIPVSGTWSAGNMGMRGLNSYNSQIFYKTVAFGNNSTTFEITQEMAENLNKLQLYVTNAPSFSNFKFRMQLVEGTAEDLVFETYVGGIESPNPDYPQTVNVVWGNNYINISNKNLLYYRDNMPEVYVNNGITYTVNEDGSIHCEGTSTGYSQLYLNTINLKAGQYTRSFKDNNNETVKIQIRKGSSSGGEIFHSDYTYYGVRTATLKADVLAYCRLVVTEGTIVDETVYPMIEIGDTRTEYVKGLHQRYQLTLPNDMFLGKLNDGENYIYGSKDNWKLHAGLKKVVLDGSESWYISNDTLYMQTIQDYKTSTGLICLCDMFKAINNVGNASAIINDNTCCFFNNSSSGVYRLYIKKSGLTVAQFKELLQNNNATLYYILENSSETDITDETLIAQLNAILSDGYTYKGDTIIYTTADTGLATNVEVDYHVHEATRINNNTKAIDLLTSNFDEKLSYNSNDMEIVDSISYFNKGISKLGDTTIEQKTLTGKNLWGGYNENTRTLGSGPTATYNSDGTIIIDGTSISGGNTSTVASATTNGLYVILPAGNYFVSGGKTNAKKLEIYDIDTSTLLGSDAGSGRAITLADTTKVMVRVTFTAEQVFENELFYIQIEAGTEATDFEPYCGGTASPNPDYPQDVHVVEGNCTLASQSKNIVDWGNMELGSTASINTFEDDVLTVGGTGSFSLVSYDILNFVKAHPGQKVHCSCASINTAQYTSSSTTIIQLHMIANGTNIYRTLLSPSGTEYTWALPEDPSTVTYAKVKVFANNANEDITSVIKISKPQLELGQVPTRYVRFAGKDRFNITLPDGMFLGALGTESNYIYGSRDNWKLHKGLDKLVLNGNEPWTFMATNAHNIDNFRYLHRIGTGSTRKQVMCNYLKDRTAGSFDNVTSSDMLWQNSAVYLDFEHDMFEASSDNLKQWLTIHTPIIYYIRQSVSEEDITDTALIQQLNEISDNLQTYKGGTLIYSTGDNLAPAIQFKYLQDPLTSIEARLELLES